MFTANYEPYIVHFSTVEALSTVLQPVRYFILVLNSVTNHRRNCPMGPMGLVPQLMKMMGPRASGLPNFGYLTVRKIINFVTTRRQILGSLNSTNFNFCWDSAPDPAGKAYSAHQTL